MKAKGTIIFPKETSVEIEEHDDFKQSQAIFENLTYEQIKEALSEYRINHRKEIEKEFDSKLGLKNHINKTTKIRKKNQKEAKRLKEKKL